MAIYIWSNEISWIYYWDTNWTPDPTRTLLYLKFNNNLNDDSWNNVSVTWAWIGYGTIGNNHYVEMTGTASWTYIKPTATVWNVIGTWDFAISFWINPVASTYSGNWQWALVFWDWNDNTTNRPWIYIQFHYYNTSSSKNKVAFRLPSTSYNRDYYLTTSATELDWTWHHIVMTRSGSTVNCYLDGWVDSVSFSSSSNINADNFFILNRSTYSWHAWTTTWAKMSEVIYEKVYWTAEEVQQYYNNTKSNYI